jgi:hypothetical protein
VTGTRPEGHVDLFLVEALDATFTTAPEDTISPAKDWAIHVGGSFADVPSSRHLLPVHREHLPQRRHRRRRVRRLLPRRHDAAQADGGVRAALARGAGYAPPAATGIFTDVPADDPFAPWIEELFNRGVVAGCGAGPTYCPDDPVLRQQMAVFLLRTLEGSSYTPPACAGVFEDVPCPSLFADWIEELYNRGVTGGCSASPLLYCPTNPVTRGQMAPFLVKTFGLVLYGP